MELRKLIREKRANDETVKIELVVPEIIPDESISRKTSKPFILHTHKEELYGLTDKVPEETVNLYGFTLGHLLFLFGSFLYFWSQLS